MVPGDEEQMGLGQRCMVGHDEEVAPLVQEGVDSGVALTEGAAIAGTRKALAGHGSV